MDHDVTTTSVINYAAGTQKSVTRSRKRGDAIEVEFLEPVSTKWLIKNGIRFRFVEGQGWTKTSHPGRPKEGPRDNGGRSVGVYVAGGESDYSGGDIIPPATAWGERPGQLLVTFRGLWGTDVLSIDWIRKVRMGRKRNSLNGGLLWEEYYEDEWKGGIRYPVKVTRLNKSGDGADYSERMDWNRGPVGIIGLAVE
jgi:hypothetical protein